MLQAPSKKKRNSVAIRRCTKRKNNGNRDHEEDIEEERIKGSIKVEK